ncbi:hypothetical protein [Micromonospora sagamiensis]|nr:hypothetical protein [Micromonospora sagamiensis]BCL14695.1 hypothetical protein GCM10017556_24340 [Micromonospora sagamiensis]
MRRHGVHWSRPEPTSNSRSHTQASRTRTAGLKELCDLGLASTRKAVVSHDGSFINFHRRRNVHVLLDQTAPTASSK